MSETSARIDKWLWCARFAKTRADAQKLIARGQVTLNGKTVAKPSATVHPGDVLAVVVGAVRHDLEIAVLGVRRGPASEAQTLYRRSAPPVRLTWEDAALPLHRRPVR